MDSMDASIFEKDNCVIFVSLIDVGVIKRAQNKFENIFGYPLKEIIGKNISMIMSQTIGFYHDRILTDFHSRFSHQNSSGNHPDHGIIPFALAKNKLGWGVPITLKFKTDFIGIDECGLSAHIKVLNTDIALVMVSQHIF